MKFLLLTLLLIPTLLIPAFGQDDQSFRNSTVTINATNQIISSDDYMLIIDYDHFFYIFLNLDDSQVSGNPTRITHYTQIESIDISFDDTDDFNLFLDDLEDDYTLFLDEIIATIYHTDTKLDFYAYFQENNFFELEIFTDNYEIDLVDFTLIIETNPLQFTIRTPILVDKSDYDNFYNNLSTTSQIELRLSHNIESQYRASMGIIENCQFVDMTFQTKYVVTTILCE